VQYRRIGDSELEVSEISLGFLRPEQVRDNAAAPGIELDAETRAEIDRALSR
jgi:aryl-alcohol dehydrogenase-like predicted oxidoreductase